MQLARESDVAAQPGQELLVGDKEMVEGSFGNVQGREGGQEVVPNQHPQQNKVIDDALQVKLEIQLRLERRKLKLEVVAQ